MAAAITDTIIDAAIIVGRTDGGDSTSSYTGRFAPTTNVVSGQNNARHIMVRIKYRRCGTGGH